MQWLKALVIGMGILIIAGLAVVIVTVVKRASGPAKPESSLNLPSRPAGDAAGAADNLMELPGFADKSIAIPPGSDVKDVISDDRRLIVRLRLAGGQAALLLINAFTGEIIGLITLHHAHQNGGTTKSK